MMYRILFFFSNNNNSDRIALRPHTDYAEFRSRLSILAGASADSILSSLDLLLPWAGGWATSHAHSNTATLQACEATGVRLNSLPDDYLDKYISFIGTAFGEMCHVAK